MKSGAVYHQETVQKALAFARGRDERTSVEDLVRFTSCSPTHLRRMFRAVTGKGILKNLREIRLERAKGLLRQSALNVGEVAAAAGFETHSAFTNAFRRISGTSPTLFRKVLSPAPPEPAGESARGPAAAPATPRPPAWQPAEGAWRWHADHAEGTSATRLALRLARPLPENFRLELTFWMSQPEKLRIALMGATSADRYAEVVLRGPEPPATPPGTLQIRNRIALSNPGAVVSPATWHTLRLELNDNRLSFALDGKPLFSHRDVFPPAYQQRCRFQISSYNIRLALKRFVLQDLGFVPVVPSIRQGDILFNAGLLDQAKDFYLRHLLPNLPAEEEMELRFKIGMCFLRQRQLDDCRSWMQSIRLLAKDGFWRREIDFVLLVVEAQADRLTDFGRLLQALFRDPVARNGILPIATEYFFGLRRAGFYERALRVAQLTLNLKEDAAVTAPARQWVVKTLKNLRRFADAKRQLSVLASDPEGYARAGALVDSSDTALMQGRPQMARPFIARVRASAPPNFHRAWCDHQEAACLRAERRFDEAIAILRGVRARYPAEPLLFCAAEFLAAEMLGCLGATRDAQRLAERARAEWPGEPADAEQRLRPHRMVSHLTTGRYRDLAVILRQESRRNDDEVARHGQEAVTAGLLFELAGARQEACKVWGEAARRFTPDRCYYWGSLAKALATGAPDRLDHAVLFWQERSEMFYLLGLLYEHRGDNHRARQYFARSIKEDPSLRWPALLALRPCRKGSRRPQHKPA
jgi:AraC-like DNA-binding protein/tetratricopeptide (TPR) repeat protein